MRELFFLRHEHQTEKDVFSAHEKQAMENAGVIAILEHLTFLIMF